METEDLAYLAGLIDSEGCLRWHGGPEVEIETCYPRTLIKYADLCGGKVTGPRLRESKDGVPYKPVYRLTFRNDEAILMLTELLDSDLLVEKEEQARLLLLMYNTNLENIPALDLALRALKRVHYVSQ